MRPKMSTRTNAAGEQIYTYICTNKERSKSEICHIKNLNGNTLDASVVEVIKNLGENKDELVKQLECIKKRILNESSGYSDTIASVKAKIQNDENEIASLVSALAKAQGTSAEKYVLSLIDKTHKHIEELKSQLESLEAASAHYNLDTIEFDIVKQMLCSFAQNIDEYSVEEKRALIKTLVRKIIWDGHTIHIYMFNSDEGYDLSLTVDNGVFAATNEPLGKYRE